MNKIIFTEDRLFMDVVGPSGCGKTDLIYNMLVGDTFYPKFEKIYYFYQQIQPIYTKMQTLLNIEFVPCIDFDMIETLENCLLIFDDSCEEIYNNKKFAKIATSGRHKDVHVIFVKHNLYHQSKQSKTIDLQSTHVILFRSPRDASQIEVLGRQLNDVSFIKACYKKAIEEPYGHLLIDFDTKTSEGLRYCSNICGPGSSTFYIKSSKAKATEIKNERERIAYARALPIIQAPFAKTVPPSLSW